MLIGIQSNAWFSAVHTRDLDGLLSQAARAGYDGVEIGAHKLDLDDPQAFNTLTARHGLAVAGIHTHGEIYTPGALLAKQESFRKAARFAREVRATCVLISGKAKPDKTGAELQTEVASLHWMADICQEQGLQLFYHTHNWELADNLRELRYLAAHTSPEKVSLALDIGWVQRAGYDPLKVIDEFYPRISYLHLKDTLDDRWTEVGKGVVDFKAVLEDLTRRGFSGWLTVERDEELEKAFESALFSRETLRGLGL